MADPHPQRHLQFDAVFVLPHLGNGGAQRVASLVASQWADAGRRICLVTTLDNKPEAHALSERVHRIRLGRAEGAGVGLGAASGATPAQGERRPRAHAVGTAPTPVRYHRRAVRLMVEAVAGPRGVDAAKRAQRRVRYRVVAAMVEGVNRIGAAGASIARSSAHFGTQGPFIVKYVDRWRWRKLLALTGTRGVALRSCLARLEAPVVVSFLTRTNVMTILATRDLSCRVVVSERNDPDLQVLDHVWDRLRRLTYPAADRVTSNATGVLQKLERFVPRTKLALLPNPVILPPRRETGADRGRRFVIAARLVHQKGLDILIDAFAEAAPACSGWSLDILGDGPLRAELTARAARRGIEHRVQFHGHVPGPSEYFLAAQVFVLPSRFEGMPNALLEAMSCGLAPIVSDSSPGPLECVANGLTGLVVRTEDVADLAEKMTLLATDDALRTRLAEEAEAFIRRNDWSEVEAVWLDVLGAPLPPDAVSHAPASASAVAP